jgi:hypothetical protein
MGISLSDFLASIALLVSIASAYYAKKQSELSNIASSNDYRAHLSDKHEEYRALLKQIDGRHRDDLASLSNLAGATLNTITDLFDTHDINRNSIRPLRHLIHESSEMVYYAFKGQLAWQSGLNISHRFAQVAHVEDKLKPQSDYFGRSDFIRVFEHRYNNEPNSRQETELTKDIYFCELVNQIKKRIDPSKRTVFLADVQEDFQAFNDLLAALKPKFGESAAILDRALEGNEIEHFHLSESPRLHRQLKYARARLDILSNLWIMKIDDEYIEKYYNYISISIYICAILHAAQDVHSWGWSRQHA